MNKILGLITAVGVLFFSIGCGVQRAEFVRLSQRVELLEKQQKVVEGKLRQVDENIVALSERTRGEKSLGKELYESIATIENEIMNIRNELDTNVADIELVKRRLDDLEAQVLELKREFELFKTKKLEEIVGRITEEKLVEKKKQISPEALYNEALTMVRGAKYKEAIDRFNKFLQMYPEHPLSANAFYWRGEAYYGLGRYKDAILVFEDFRRKYPKSNKVPASLLKEALAFMKLGDKKAAKILLNKLVSDYPKSPQALTAKRILSTL